MPKVVRRDLLGDPLGKSRGTRGVKIGVVNKKKSGPTSKRGRTRPIGQFPVLRGMGNLTRGMKNLSDCID